MSVYWGKTFFQFFALFFSRIFLIFFQQEPLASDELQLFVLILLSVTCAALGVFLVVRKMTMIANAVTHTALLGIMVVVIAGYYLFGSEIAVMSGGAESGILLLAALISSIFTMFLVEVLTVKFRLQNDVSIGLVFSFFFALGIILATIFTRSTHIGTEVITGNIDLITAEDVKFSLYLCMTIIFLVGIFYRPLLISSFDSQFATTSGIKEKAMNYVIVLATSLTVMVSMQVVGVVLVLALLVVPVLTSRLYFNSLKLILFVSMAIGGVSSLFAVAGSRHLLSVYEAPVSTAGLLVAILFLVWLIFSLGKFLIVALTFQKKADKVVS